MNDAPTSTTMRPPALDGAEATPPHAPLSPLVAALRLAKVMVRARGIRANQRSAVSLAVIELVEAFARPHP